jgi:Rrf2 family protein
LSTLLRISEAASLAFHAVALLASEPGEQRSTSNLARNLKVSEAHLSKVLQRLGRHGLVRSSRGPRGGWMISSDPEKVTLLQVYEAVEGPLAPSSCLLGGRRCNGQSCILGGLLDVVNRQVMDYLSNTRLASLACAYLPLEVSVT